MIVVLAEKPSVANDIAKVLGANRRSTGYFEGNGYRVTFAFGHLVKICEPEKINKAWSKPWQLSQLPMIPENWRYEVNSSVASQFSIIKKLFLDPSTTSIVSATDAGREGEHIFRLIYQLTGCKLPVSRLWISSLTEHAIKDGFKNLRPLSDFDNLAKTALARSHADWLVGLNFTRAYTLINNQLLTVGRVQTPTLALLTARHEQIANFKPEVFYEIKVKFAPDLITTFQTSVNDKIITRISDKDEAQKILEAIKPKKTGIVKSVKNSPKVINPKALFDLLTLQKEANRLFGYTANQVLEIAQTLYEKHKLITYPRTESRYLSTDIIGELPAVINNLLKSRFVSSQVIDVLAKNNLKAGSITVATLKPYLTKSYVDDNKLTDHHAIIPTAKTAFGDLSQLELNVYKLIFLRFLAVFLPKAVFLETNVVINVDDYSFGAKGTVVKDPGWTLIDEFKSQAQDSENQLPDLTVDQVLTKLDQKLNKGQTTPPKPYDDGSLLTAMKNANQNIDDEDLASYMKQNGLGTPATRSLIIERLIQSNYVTRVKKTLQPTDKGIALIENIHPKLKDIALTAVFEEKLARILDGKLNLDSFETDISSFVSEILPVIVKQKAIVPVNHKDAIGTCPLCKSGQVLINKKALGCSQWKEGCKFTLWRKQYGKQLTDNQLKELFINRKTKVISGFKKKSDGSSYEARLIMTDDFKVSLDFSFKLDLNLKKDANAK